PERHRVGRRHRRGRDPLLAARPGGQRAHKFFAGRRPLEIALFDHGAEAAGLREYVNVSPHIGMIISRDPSMLVHLTSTLGLRDLYDLVEVMQIDGYNDRVMERNRRAKER